MGRSNVTTAQLLVDSGINILQYREKAGKKDRKTMVAECEKIRKITADAHVPFIINDFLDIAMITGADGVHMGQTDLPMPAVKQLAPPSLGGLLHPLPSPRRSRQSGRGRLHRGRTPVCHRTKEDVCDPVGLDYLEHVATHVDIPFVAIGGIKRHNLAQVVSRGQNRVSGH